MEEGLGKRVRETDALTSRVTKEQRGSSTALGGSAKDSVTKENLRWYYDNRFPIRQMFTWVRYVLYSTHHHPFIESSYRPVFGSVNIVLSLFSTFPSNRLGSSSIYFPF